MNIAAENTRYIDRQTMPAKLGRSLAWAALSLAFAPVALGPLGIVAGTVAVWKGAPCGGAQSVSRLALWQLQDDGPADVT